jgi:hypothetical protein
MTVIRTLALAAVAAAATALAATAAPPALAQRSPSYGPPIAMPEPWLANRRRSIAKPHRPNVTKHTVRRLRAAPPGVVIVQPEPPSPSFLSVQPPPMPPAPPRLALPGGPAPLDSFGDRAVRCIHHGTAWGVPGSEMPVYTHTCASR